MLKLSTVSTHKWTLLIAVLVLFVPTTFAYAGIGAWFYEYIVLGLFGWLLGLAGVILNYAVNHYVVGFGTQYVSGGVGAIVETMWVIVRDLFNLTFIFGLVFIGFKMILRIDDGNSRRWLINLILAALLVNFSLFITKFVIDFSNILAVSVINQGLEGANPLFSTEPFQIGNSAVQIGVDISESMMQQTGAQTAFLNVAALTAAGESFSIIFGTLLIFIVGIFVYLSAALLLIVRAAVLIVLMMVSPFLFLGMVIPTFSGFSRNLWSTLLKRAFVAPIYIIFLYITLSVAGSIRGEGEESSLIAGMIATSDTVGQDAAASFGPFILVTVLLLMSLVAAQKLGAEGASTMINMGQNMRKSAQKKVSNGTRYLGRKAGAGAGALTVGAGAAGARRSLGRLGNNIGNNKKWQSGNAFQRGAAAVGAKVGSASFDPRSEKGGVLGKGQTGGYAATEKEQKKKEEERAKALEQNPHDANGDETEEYENFKAKDDEYQEAASEVENAKTEKLAADELVEASNNELQGIMDTNDELRGLRADLLSIESEAMNAQDPQEKLAAQQLAAETRQAITSKEGEIGEKYRNNNSAIYNQAKAADANYIEADNKLKSEETRVEGNYRYEYVDKLKEQRNTERERWSTIKGKSKVGRATSYGVGAGGGALVGAAVAGPIGAIVGAAIGVAMRGSAGAAEQTSKKRVDTVTEYATKGRKKLDNKGRTDFYKNLQEEMKEYGETQETETTQNSNTDDSEKNNV